MTGCERKRGEMINDGPWVWGLSKRTSCDTNQLSGKDREEALAEWEDVSLSKVLLVSRLMFVTLVVRMLRQESSLK